MDLGSDFDAKLKETLAKAIGDGFKGALERSYDNPLKPIFDAAFEAQKKHLAVLVASAAKEAVNDPAFVKEFAAQLRQAMVKQFVAGVKTITAGRVKSLQSDPKLMSRIEEAVSKVLGLTV